MGIVYTEEGLLMQKPWNGNGLIQKGECSYKNVEMGMVYSKLPLASITQNSPAGTLMKYIKSHSRCRCAQPLCVHARTRMIMYALHVTTTLCKAPAQLLQNLESFLNWRYLREEAQTGVPGENPWQPATSRKGIDPPPPPFTLVKTLKWERSYRKGWLLM